MSYVKYDHEKAIEQLHELLPHGSGIDCKWEFDVLKNGKIKASNSFHCMTEHGYYDGYADFTLTFDVTKSLRAYGLVFNGRVAQSKNRKYMLRDYLEDTIYHSLPADKSIFALSL